MDINIDIIINNSTFDFKKKFFENIILQCNHLKKNIAFEKDPSKRIEILTTLLLSGIIFKEYKENYELAIKELEKFTKSYFDNDGFPLTRSSNDLIYFLKYFLLCHENIKDAQQYVPEFLDDIINKNLNCIKFFKTPYNQVPLFNGASEENLDPLEKYIEIIIEKKSNQRKFSRYIFYKI